MQRLIQIGKLKSKMSSEVEQSRLGIGFEKLDRDAFDPELAYDYVAQLGVKWVRIQSGWAKTEKEKGVYDFAWLDAIVDNLLKRGLVPWLCLCYGNALYDEAAKGIFGAVGIPPIYNEEDRSGWNNYVTATVEHFKGRIGWYEIWNEPEANYSWNQHGDGQQYGEFAVRTAKAIKAADADAKIIGGAYYARNIFFQDASLATGMAQLVDAVSFHEYTPNELKIPETVEYLTALCHTYNPKIRLIQGESGSQSRSDGAGAMRGAGWTPVKQAKQLLRHTVMDLSTDVLFTSFFSCMDMIEAHAGVIGDKASYMDFGYFGLLSANFDENGYADGNYTPKPSYHAYQNLASLFAGEVVPAGLPILKRQLDSRWVLDRDCADASIVTKGFKKSNGAAALAYWNATNLMTTSFESTISFTCAALGGEVHIVDPMQGSIFCLPENMCEKSANGWTLKNLPLLDYPLVITFGDFADMQCE